jgi:Spy/CpxP family protein refolding chaperone
MKTSILLLFVIGAALSFLSPRTVLADNPAPADSTTAGSSDGQGQREERWKAAIAALDLTDAQKLQIKQIRSTVTDKKERRQQIMAVLTPEQKEKLRQMFEQYRKADGGTASST